MDSIRTGVARFATHADGALAEVQDDPRELEHLRAEVEGFLAQIVARQAKLASR